MSTGTLALILFTAILAQVVVIALIGMWRRKQQYPALGPESGGSSRPVPKEKLPAPGPEPGQFRGWEGFKDFIVQRRLLEDPNGSVCSFYLVPADGEPLPLFRPGQYLTFKLPLRDPASGEPRTAVRCYSLSDRPGADYYRVTIKRVPPPPTAPDAPPGLSSNYFHDQVAEGARLSVRAPAGHFFLRDEPVPIVLIAGGIGITPMLSMLNHLVQDGSPREIWLFYGVRNAAEHPMKDYLQGLGRDRPGFHLHVCYSAPSPGDLEGIDYQHRGHVDIQLLRASLRLQRYQFYVCGPKPMMETLVPALEDWGVAPGDIHYESFGPASLTRHEKPAEAPTREIRVSFSKSGRSIPWSTGMGSLLELAETQRIPVESGCRAGSCGCCQTRLEAGEVDYSQQPDADIEPGHCLLCITTPKTDITLAT